MYKYKHFNMWSGLQKGDLRVKESFFTFFAIHIDFEMLFQMVKTESPNIIFSVWKVV